MTNSLEICAKAAYDEMGKRMSKQYDFYEHTRWEDEDEIIRADWRATIAVVLQLVTAP